MKRKLKKSKWSNLSFFKKNILLIMLCFTLLSISSIAYSALNKQLNITGDLIVRAVKDIRITDLKLRDQVTSAYEMYNSKYTVNTVSVSAKFPTLYSAIYYNVTVTNSGDKSMKLIKLDTSTSNNTVSYSITGLKLNDIVKPNSTVTFTLELRKTLDIATASEISSALIELDWEETDPVYTDPILAGSDPNLLNGSLEIVLLNRLHKDNLIDEKTYKQAKESIVREYKLEGYEIDFIF